MKISKWILLFAAAFVLILLLCWRETPRPREYPSDWLFRQRAFPHGDINEEVYREALRQTRALRRQSLAQNRSWEFAGPTNIGGRITDVEMSPTSFDTIYAGAASGGLFKSVDRGQTWIPIFDRELSLSIGDIALDPANPQIIYVGTGEANAGGGSVTYGGFGVYKSQDGGETWQHLGLEETQYIGRVVVDPRETQRIYVAAMGRLFAKNRERGLYRSNDGGASWQNILFVSDSTGCIDVVLHPHSSDTLYAAMWERIRRPDRRSYGGATSGIFRSTDGGESWIELRRGLAQNAQLRGRIGLALAASDPKVLYAIYADRTGYFVGIYKSIDAGDTWQQTNDRELNNFYASYGWWFGNIRVDPEDADNVYALGLEVYRSTNGGGSWFYSSGYMHVDQHGFYIHPQNVDFIVAGNDGGVYLSDDGGSNWIKSPGLPITQFYTSEVDYQFPQRLYGGTQDNGTNRTLTGGRQDWALIWYGDGFYVLVDPTDNQFVYAESQNGGLVRSSDGGYDFNSALSGVDFGERCNWNMPVVFNPRNPQSLCLGRQRVYKSADRAVSWTAISADLSQGPPSGNLSYGTVTTIAVAPSDTNVIYSGTDDGNVWVTLDHGENWQLVSGDLPLRWITRVAVDPQKAQTAYVTLSGYRADEYLPHIFRTTDAGATWQDISGNLPETPLNDVIVDPALDSTLYVAGDVGVFMTSNLGVEWQLLGEGLPNVAVTDLTLHPPTRTLVAATYGRSMYKIALSPVSAVQAPAEAGPPIAFALAQNHPNPFTVETAIAFSLNQPAHIAIELFNVRGQRVRLLAEGPHPGGAHRIIWNGEDDRGRALASGVYFCRLSAAGAMAFTKRMLLLRPDR